MIFFLLIFKNLNFFCYRKNYLNDYEFLILRLNITGGGGADVEVAQSIININDVINSDSNEIISPLSGKLLH